MSDKEIRLIDANKLEQEAYSRFGLNAIKFITLVQEQPTIEALPIEYPSGVENER